MNSLADSLRARMIQALTGASSEQKANPLVEIGLSKAILNLPLTNEQLHAAVRNYSRRLAGVQNEQLDQDNPSYRVESAELKARRFRIYEAHSRIDALSDFLDALREFTELHSEEKTQIAMLRAKINTLRDAEREMSRQQDEAGLRELRLKRMEGEIKRERVQLEADKDQLRRQVARTDLAVLLEQQKKYAAMLKARAVSLRKLNKALLEGQELALKHWLQYAVRRSSGSQSLWQSVFEARRMVLIEFSFDRHWDDTIVISPLPQKQLEAEQELLRSLGPVVQQLHKQVIDSFTRVVKAKMRGTNLKLVTHLTTVDVINGAFEVKMEQPPAKRGAPAPSKIPGAQAPIKIWERVMGSLPIEAISASRFKQLDRLPARFAGGACVPFIVPGNVLVSCPGKTFTAMTLTPAELYQELAATSKVSALRSRRISVNTSRIILAVE